MSLNFEHLFNSSDYSLLTTQVKFTSDFEPAKYFQNGQDLTFEQVTYQVSKILTSYGLSFIFTGETALLLWQPTLSSMCQNIRVALLGHPDDLTPRVRSLLSTIGTFYLVSHRDRAQELVMPLNIICYSKSQLFSMDLSIETRVYADFEDYFRLQHLSLNHIVFDTQPYATKTLAVFIEQRLFPLDPDQVSVGLATEESIMIIQSYGFQICCRDPQTLLTAQIRPELCIQAHRNDGIILHKGMVKFLYDRAMAKPRLVDLPHFELSRACYQYKLSRPLTWSLYSESPEAATFSLPADDYFVIVKLPLIKKMPNLEGVKRQAPIGDNRYHRRFYSQLLHYVHHHYPRVLVVGNIVRKALCTIDTTRGCRLILLDPSHTLSFNEIKKIWSMWTQLLIWASTTTQGRPATRFLKPLKFSQGGVQELNPRYIRGGFPQKMNQSQYYQLTSIEDQKYISSDLQPLLNLRIDVVINTLEQVRHIFTTQISLVSYNKIVLSTPRDLFLWSNTIRTKSTDPDGNPIEDLCR